MKLIICADGYLRSGKLTLHTEEVIGRQIKLLKLIQLKVSVSFIKTND